MVVNAYETITETAVITIPGDMALVENKNYHFTVYVIGRSRDKETIPFTVLATEQSKKSYVAPWMITAVYAGLGQKDKAFEWLEKSFKERDHWLTYIKKSPLVDNLRSDPRFPKMLKRMGFNK